jgi:sulfide:quinone oxidoreductase
MSRVLVLGGGFGGIAAAVALRKLLPSSDEVVLVERRTSFVMGLRKNWALTGVSPLADGQRQLSTLGERGIQVVHGKINEIFPAECAIEVDTERIQGDAMVISLGASRNLQAVPGFDEHAIDYYEPDNASKGAEAIRSFTGGRVVIGIFGAPYPCPPAPYELALMLSERFAEERVPGGIFVFTPQPGSLPILGDAACSAFDGRLAAAGISFRPKTQATEVQPGVVIAGDVRIPFDLLIGVAPHRVPPVLAAAGFTHGAPYVHVNPTTLETAFPNIYAIGDAVGIPLKNGMPLPKAGAFAHAEAEVVAARIADRLAGREPTAAFTGEGTCFLETGRGKAVTVSGSFYADPPNVVMSEDSEANFAAKQAFESDRLTAWFGA